jgi:TRAP-type C4-dicarboxylate transport system permease small subunit
VSRAVAIAQRLLRFAAGMFLVALALLTLLDVLGRYVFNLPVRGAVELTESLMVGVIFTGIVLATQVQQHVTVDLLATSLGPRGRRLQRSACELLSAGVSLLLTAVTWNQAFSAREFGERTTILGLPTAPLLFFMTACLFLNAVLHAAQSWRLWAEPMESA